MSQKEKFIVIDGNSLIYRAFFALPLLTTSQGIFTNAVYGFTNMLLKIIEDEKPEYLGVAFDKGRPTFRLQTYAEYKGHRPQMPDELRPQFSLAKQVLEAMDIPVIELEGYEADDLIGTLVTQAELREIHSVIVTGDRDSFQLVSPLSHVLLTRKGITEVERVDEAQLYEKYQLKPKQIVDLKGLMGDSSDNIPGVAGVGEKTALKLLHQFNSIEVLYQHLDEVKGKLKDKLAESEDKARLSRELATIVRDVPIVVDWDCLRVCPPDDHKLLDLYKALEFKNLVKKLMERLQAQPVETDNKGEQTVKAREVCALALGEEEIQRLKDLPAGSTVALMLLGDNAHWQQSGVLGGVLSLNPGQGLYFNISENSCPLWLKDLLERADIQKVCHDGKRLNWLCHNMGVKLQGLFFDIMIAAYLVNPAKPSQDLTEVCLEYLNAVIPTLTNHLTWCQWVDSLWLIRDELQGKLTEQAMDELFYQVEMPLVTVLAETEMAGVKVDASMLSEMSLRLGESVQQLTAEIYQIAGEQFNINSTRQLGQILFEKLQLPVIKKTKTGYSTDASVLEELAERHEIVQKLLQYRQLVKLKSTYVDGLTGLINPTTGKIHTTFNQTVTATGRLSSTEPNLQNIPIRMEEGRKIRKVFVPSEADHIILTADYSQIELRILAHISEDENLREAFIENQDVHTRTASEVFGVPIDEVTREMRHRAKAVNFGIVYGISDYGLSQDIKVTRKEAKIYIDKYFARYPKVKEYIDRVIQEARETGYVTTILNRRRYLPDLFSSNFNVRSFGERTAMNTPIQGSAADIIKLAMIEIQKEIKARGLRSRMILQVHDELIFDVPSVELDEMLTLVREYMQEAVALNVPLVVDVKTGPSWYDVTPI